MSQVYVFAASKMEGESIVQIARSHGTEVSDSAAPFRAGPNHVALMITGMGPQAARAKAMQAFSPLEGDGPRPVSFDKPEVALVIGLCGGLAASLPESRVVAYTQCLSTEPRQYSLDCSPSLTARLRQLLASSGIACEPAIGITSPRIGVNKKVKLALAEFGASAVDMESYEIMAVAAQARVPAVVLRVVADTLDSNLPDLNRALNAQGSLDGRKALRVALGSPVRTYRLLASNKRAIRELAKALAIVVPSNLFSEPTL